jgi:hypothetical protein
MNVSHRQRPNKKMTPPVITTTSHLPCSTTSVLKIIKTNSSSTTSPTTMMIWMIQVIHLLTIDSGNVSVIEEKGGELSREGATMRVKKKGLPREILRYQEMGIYNHGDLSLLSRERDLVGQC